MLTRTRRGVAALIDALLPHSSLTPERAAWAVSADAAGIAQCAGWKKTALVAEPLTRVALAAVPLRVSRDPVLACAVLASGVAAFEQERVPHAPSALGVGTLASAQAGYLTRLLQRDAAVGRVRLAVAVGAVAAGGAVAAWADRRLLPATLIGGAAVAATAAAANDPIFRADTNDPAREGLSHGANLLLGAEGLRLLTNAGLVGKACDAVGLPARVGERGARAAVSWAGSIGQLLLVHGLSAPAAAKN